MCVCVCVCAYPNLNIIGSFILSIEHEEAKVQRLFGSPSINREQTYLKTLSVDNSPFISPSHFKLLSVPESTLYTIHRAYYYWVCLKAHYILSTGLTIIECAWKHTIYYPPGLLLVDSRYWNLYYFYFYSSSARFLTFFSVFIFSATETIQMSKRSDFWRHDGYLFSFFIFIQLFELFVFFHLFFSNRNQWASVSSNALRS